MRIPYFKEGNNIISYSTVCKSPYNYYVTIPVQIAKRCDLSKKDSIKWMLNEKTNELNMEMIR